MFVRQLRPLVGDCHVPALLTSYKLSIRLKKIIAGRFLSLSFEN